MTEFKIVIKHDRYSDVDYFTPRLTVDNLLTIEDFEYSFMNDLCKWIDDYWKEKEK